MRSSMLPIDWLHGIQHRTGGGTEVGALLSHYLRFGSVGLNEVVNASLLGDYGTNCASSSVAQPKTKIRQVAKVVIFMRHLSFWR